MTDNVPLQPDVVVDLLGPISTLLLLRTAVTGYIRPVNFVLCIGALRLAGIQAMGWNRSLSMDYGVAIVRRHLMLRHVGTLSGRMAISLSSRTSCLDKAL